MNNEEQDDQISITMKAADEPPLDPAVERVRKKLMRLMLSTIVVTFVLLLAVLVAIFYKIIAPSQKTHTSVQESLPNQTNNSSAVAVGNEEPILRQLHIDSHSRVISTNISGNRILLAVARADGKKQLIIYDFKLGETIAVISLVD